MVLGTQVENGTRMTAAEFRSLPETMQPMELIEGEVIVSPSPTLFHQRNSRNTVFMLQKLIPNGEILYAPMDVEFDEENVPQPDVIWIAEGSLCKAIDGKLVGAPDLVVEIFSSSTAKLDKTRKFSLYERHGVREYWMIDPYSLYVEVYTLQEGIFLRLGVYGEKDAFESPVLGGKTVSVNAIFAT